MAERPILEAIRALLAFKDHATIAEIARIAEVTQKRALEVVNANGRMVWRDRKTGRITKVDPAGVWREELRKSGNYYFITSYGAWCREGDEITFDGREELAAPLRTKVWTGGIGDSWEINVILDTPENRAAIEDAGLLPWSAAEKEIDDRLWKE